MSFTRYSKHKAAKLHECDWCGGKIKIGEMYHYHVGVCEGDFSATKLHQDCQDQINHTISKEPNAHIYDFYDLRMTYESYYKDKWVKGGTPDAKE